MENYIVIVPIDGNTVCDASNKKADGSFSKVHIASAWVSVNGITLGREKVDEKSNEIRYTAFDRGT